MDPPFLLSIGTFSTRVAHRSDSCWLRMLWRARNISHRARAVGSRSSSAFRLGKTQSAFDSQIDTKLTISQVEEDNSAVRNLQYIQASMIWLDVCSFCGFKRKMEIAESNLQPLVTVRLPRPVRTSFIDAIWQALRRFNKFESFSYDRVVPMPDDSREVVKEKWYSWVEQESYKRSVVCD